MKNRINCYVRVTDPAVRAEVVKWAKKNKIRSGSVCDDGCDYIVFYDGSISNTKFWGWLIKEGCYEFVDCGEDIQLFYVMVGYDTNKFHLQYFVDAEGRWAQGVSLRDAKGRMCYCIDELDDDFNTENFRHATKEELIKKAKSWTCTTK